MARCRCVLRPPHRTPAVSQSPPLCFNVLSARRCALRAGVAATTDGFRAQRQYLRSSVRSDAAGIGAQNASTPARTSEKAQQRASSASAPSAAAGFRVPAGSGRMPSSNSRRRLGSSAAPGPAGVGAGAAAAALAGTRFARPRAAVSAGRRTPAPVCSFVCAWVVACTRCSGRAEAAGG